MSITTYPSQESQSQHIIMILTRYFTWHSELLVNSRTWQNHLIPQTRLCITWARVWYILQFIFTLKCFKRIRFYYHVFYLILHITHIEFISSFAILVWHSAQFINNRSYFICHHVRHNCLSSLDIIYKSLYVIVLFPPIRLSSRKICVYLCIELLNKQHSYIPTFFFWWVDADWNIECFSSTNMIIIINYPSIEVNSRITSIKYIESKVFHRFFAIIRKSLAVRRIRKWDLIAFKTRKSLARRILRK